MATLFGAVFFSHQLGSFAGVYLGGYLYDTTGTYDTVWWAGVVLGLLAAIVQWPIDEKPLARLNPPNWFRSGRATPAIRYREDEASPPIPALSDRGGGRPDRVRRLRCLPMAWSAALGSRVARWIGPLLPLHHLAHDNLRAAIRMQTKRIAGVLTGMWDN